MRFFRILILSLFVAVLSSLVSLVFIHLLLGYEYFVLQCFSGGIVRSLFVAISVFVGSFLLFIFKEFHARGAGVENIIRDYHLPLIVFRIRTLFLKIISTIVAIGGGGSGGVQGPSVYIGGFIGGWIAEKFRVNYIERKTLILSGIAAVLSAIFRAPLGAIFYAIEVPYKRDFETKGIIPVVIGSIVGLLVSVFLNVGYDFEFPRLLLDYSSLLDPYMILLYVLFGLYIVLVSISFVYLDRLTYRLGEFIRKYIKLELIVVTMFSLMVSLIIFLMPTTYGTGISYVSHALSDFEETLAKLSIISLFVLIYAKMLATSLTIKSGASAGYFGPGIFIGALSGVMYYKILGLFGINAKDPLVFAYLGMAAFYGSISATPIGTSILITELTGNYFFILPSLLSSLLARELIINKTLYKSQRTTRLKNDIERLLESLLVISRHKPELLDEPISVITLPKPTIIDLEDTLDKTLVIILNSRSRVIPVRRNNNIIGVIDIRRINPTEILTKKRDSIKEYILETPIVKTNTTIKEIIDIFTRKNIDTIIVINELNEYQGILDMDTLQRHLLYLAWWLKNDEKPPRPKRS